MWPSRPKRSFASTEDGKNIQKWSGWWFWQSYHLEKYEFVNWDYDIPNRWKNQIHVPNHQAVIVSCRHFSRSPETLSGLCLRWTAGAQQYEKNTIEKQLDVVGFLFREKKINACCHVKKHMFISLYIYSNSNGFPQRILPNRSLNLNKLEHWSCPVTHAETNSAFLYRMLRGFNLKHMGGFHKWGTPK